MISRSAAYALKAMLELARLPAGELGHAAGLAQRTGAPANYLSKLLKLLTQAGLLESRKGLNGGFMLKQPPSAISLYDIAEPIDHVSRWELCFFSALECDCHSPCPVHHSWEPVRGAHLGFLKQTTLADLLAGHA